MNTQASPHPRPAALTILLHRWPVLVALALAYLTPHALLPTAIVLVGCAVSYPVFGTVMKQWRTGKLLAFHLAVVALIAAIAILALQVDVTVSRYLLGGAFLAHALWDIYHFRIKQIVPRWYAEACGVFDLILATVIIFLPFE